MSEEHVVQLRHEFAIVNGANETIAGITVMRRHNALWLTNLWVHHEHRKKGLGKKVFEAALKEFVHERLYLHVWPYGNQPLDEEDLFAWYSKYGFEHQGAGVMVRCISL